MAKTEIDKDLVETVDKVWAALSDLNHFVAPSEYGLYLFFLSYFRGNRFEDLKKAGNGLEWQEIWLIFSYHFPKKDDPDRFMLDHYRPIIERFTGRDFEFIEFHFSQLYQPKFESRFSEIFELLLKRITYAQGRTAHNNMLPANLARFLCQLADLPANATVYNPFAGYASFGLYLPKDATYVGEEISVESWIIATLRLKAHGKEDSIFFFRGDSIENWNREYRGYGLQSEITPDGKAEWRYILPDGSTTSEVPDRTYDLVISSPPLGYKIPRSYADSALDMTAETFLFAKTLVDNTLKQNGKLISQVSTSLLTSSSQLQLRKKLIDQDLLETIILLPGGVLENTQIPIAIVVMNLKKRQPGVVQMIDASTFQAATRESGKPSLDYDNLLKEIESGKASNFVHFVQNSTIASDNYSWQVARYTQESTIGVSLGKIAHIVNTTKVEVTTPSKVVRIRNLQNDLSDYHLNTKLIEETIASQKCQKITESCLLVATRWKTLKPTYFEYMGEPIYLSSDVCALSIDQQKAEIGFIISELHSQQVESQVNALTTGTVVPFLTKKDLLAIKIALLSLSEQKVHVERLQKAFLESKKSEVALFAKIYGLENELLTQNTHLRHSLAGPASNLLDSIINIRRIIIDQIVPSMPNTMHLKISEKHELTMSDYLEIIERDSKKIEATVRTRLKVESHIDSVILFPMDLLNFLDRFVKEQNQRETLPYKLEFGYDKEAFLDDNSTNVRWQVMANEGLLQDLFNNLLENAIQHAFGDDTSANRIEIYLTRFFYPEGDNSVTILFSNTGKSFPENFGFDEFVTKGFKAGPGANEGFGGWYINEIVKKLNGTLAIIDETGPEGFAGSGLATSFEICLPLQEFITIDEL